MIPITLVTGFLGSGKTTLLQRIAETSSGRQRIYLVNEFSSADVDGPALKNREVEVVSIPGGSIFCRCLVSEFIAQLSTIRGRRAAGSDGPSEGLVVEASGVADPRVIGDLLRETGLDGAFRIDLIVTVVDPGTFVKLIETLPNIQGQVESADVVLVNKCDLHDEGTIQATEEAVRRIRPAARVVRTSYCRVDCELLRLEQEERDLHGEFALCRDPSYRSLEVAVRGDIDLDWLREELAARGSAIYRVKGCVPSGGKPHAVDFSAGRLSVRPGCAEGPERTLACIVAGEAPSETVQFLERLGADPREADG